MTQPSFPYRTAVVTGASSGFGAAIAEQLAAHGVRLVLVGRRGDRLEALQARLPSPAHVLALDVRDRDEVLAAFASLPPEFAQVEVLINNAGLALGANPVPTTSLDDWEQMVATNINGVLYCTHALLPILCEQPHAHIINMGSIAGHYPYPGGNAYGGTKAFIAQFSANLRADLLGKHVRVTCIEPGMAETEFSLVRYHGDDHKAKAVYHGIQPLTAHDVAEATLWALRQPPHVNINHIELMPTMQAAAGLAVKRQ